MVTNLRQDGLNRNEPLTNIIQGVKTPANVMQCLYPLVETSDYDGQIIKDDDSIYEDMDDDQADDTPYNEIQDGYTGIPYNLDTKGIQYRIGKRKQRQRRRSMGGTDAYWGRRATRRMVQRAMLKHEIEAAALATDLAKYHADNQITLGAGEKLNDNSNDPTELILAGKTVVSGKIGMDPNVAVLGRLAFDAIRMNTNISGKFLPDGIEGAMLYNERALANLWGLDEVKICNAIVKNKSGARNRVFGPHVVLGYTNPDALRSNNRISLGVNRNIDEGEPGMGYTLVYEDSPQVMDPFIDRNRGGTLVYTLEFDRKVLNTGLDSGNLIESGYIIHSVV